MEHGAAPSMATHAGFHTIDTLFVDLDGTLYPIGNGYEDRVRNNLFGYMRTHLGVPRDQARQIWRPLFAKYNQSLRGLRAGGYNIKAEEYWDCIRAGAEDYLKPDPVVRSFLMGLRQADKWVFTNCSEKHAWHALQLLDLKDCFKGVIGSDLMGDACKPEGAAFQAALQHSGADLRRAAMFEDSVKNLRAAKALGMTTLLVTGATAWEEGAVDSAALACCDAVVPVLHEAELRAALPCLWRTRG